MDREYPAVCLQILNVQIDQFAIANASRVERLQNGSISDTKVGRHVHPIQNRFHLIRRQRSCG